ncbi:Vimentin-type intermediate filament-associated coiled-coil protein [Heterocephalus glaber]|uniref:Vimentin-type intermediate filament-associated coiled-coil protein n=1 Tax=Heterocephalus glaber TaxID=10181 RepID=G5C0P6_HETGA|nr:Vimentin-type intermediate filament-associated coiled-coil protein [Heterocephalus glaber]
MKSMPNLQLVQDQGRIKSRAQAERLARHDHQLRAALEELGHAKDREIEALQEQLLTSEAAVQSLQAAVHQRDELIGQLRPRAELLQDACRRRPPLAALLAALAEAEHLGPLPDSAAGHLLPGGPGPPLTNSTAEEEKAEEERASGALAGQCSQPPASRWARATPRQQHCRGGRGGGGRGSPPAFGVWDNSVSPGADSRADADSPLGTSIPWGIPGQRQDPGQAAEAKKTMFSSRPYADV